MPESSIAHKKVSWTRGITILFCSVVYTCFFAQEEQSFLIYGVSSLYFTLTLKSLPAFLSSKVALLQSSSKYHMYLSYGLVLSALGDLLLDLVPSFGDLAFIAGLASFLIAHVLYSISFAHNLKWRFSYLQVAFVCCVPGLSMLFLLYPHIIAS